MKCCINCKNPYNFGCVSVCGKLNIGIEAVIEGEYTLLTSFAGKRVKIKQIFVEDELICFDISCLNESYLFHFIIIGPDGKPFCVEHNGDVYDSFQIRTEVGECQPNAAPAFTVVDCDLVEYIEPSKCEPLEKTAIVADDPNAEIIEMERVSDDETETETMLVFNVLDFLPDDVETMVDNFKKSELTFIAQKLGLSAKGLKADIAQRILNKKFS